MLYLLGGAARSGKTIIARRFLAEKGIPFFSLDFLAHGLARTYPQLQIDLNSDDVSVGESLWPLAKLISTMMILEEHEYLLEGALIQPKHAQEIRLEFPTRVRACFVGFADAEIGTKFQQVKRYGGGPDDWMAEFNDKTVLEELSRLKTTSNALREACKQYQLQYFETSAEFEQSVQKVVAFLAG